MKHPFLGLGVNTHAEFLPVDKLIEAGVRWVRTDLAIEGMDWDLKTWKSLSVENVRAHLEHYSPLPVLFILAQKSPDLEGAIAIHEEGGATNLEVGNECNIPDFNPDGLAWTPEKYMEFFDRVSASAKKETKLYGPASSFVDVAYVKSCLDLGLGEQVSAVTVHGYGTPAAQLPAVISQLEVETGLQVIVSENGFGGYPDVKQGFVTAAEGMGFRPWCHYDGPETYANGGFFKFDEMAGGWTEETPLLETSKQLAAKF